MPIEIVSIYRKFRIWHYTISHGQLLLRSVKAPGVETRYDILFKDVAAIQLPVEFEKLAIFQEPNAKELSSNNVPFERIAKRRKIYALYGGDFPGYLVAGAIYWHEDTRSYFEPSHFDLKI